MVDIPFRTARYREKWNAHENRKDKHSVSRVNLCGLSGACARVRQWFTRGKTTHRRYVQILPVYLHTDNELKPLLENRCYLSKSVSERAELVHKMNQMPDADFTKTMRELDAINASDRLLGTKGCDVEESRRGQNETYSCHRSIRDVLHDGGRSARLTPTLTAGNGSKRHPIYSQSREWSNRNNRHGERG